MKLAGRTIVRVASNNDPVSHHLNIETKKLIKKKEGPLGRQAGERLYKPNDPHAGGGVLALASRLTLSSSPARSSCSCCIWT